MTNPNQIEVDVAVIGGGVAALWTANALRRAGYSIAVISNSDFGVGQTLAAQGVIHGGLKYALGGKLTESSEALAAAPERWRRCLRGEGEVDLTGVEVLSEFQILWSLPQVASRIMAFLGSKALETRAGRIPRDEFPAPFDHPDYGGNLFQLDEMALDPISIVEGLARGVAEVSGLGELEWDGNGGARVGGARIQAKRWVLAAGAGNESLTRAAGIAEVPMQRRPLHQVVIRSESLPPMFSVCIGTGAKPPIVVTTHRDSAGRKLWYVGGDLAETGVAREPEAQIAFAKERFQQLLPWLDLRDADWSTVRIDRAEPKTTTRDRPAGAFCEARGNVLVTWPTKLALAPNLADQVLVHVRESGLTPTPQPEIPLPRPGVGKPPWNS